MEYARYFEMTQQAAQHDAAGEHTAALAIFLELMASDISEIDKSLMAYNAATMLEKLGQPEDALAAYDRAMELEHRYSRNFAAEHKAAFLHRLGRVAESLRLYEELARRATLTEEERHRITQNVQTLRREAG